MIIERTVFMARTMNGRAAEIKRQNGAAPKREPHHAWLWTTTVAGIFRSAGHRQDLPAPPRRPGREDAQGLHGRMATGSQLTGI